MPNTSTAEVRAAEIELPCAELEETLPFFTNRLGFRVDAIFPADDPATAVISGYGLRLRLRRGGSGQPGTVRLLCNDPSAFANGQLELTAPNGTRIELVAANPPLEMPPVKQSFVVDRMGADAQWGVGRAGMGYRDLIPDRQGGRFIASHIRIADGGPVPDNVHFHQVRFQMIYCYRGWVKVVYEDQGPPFVLEAGDCVLQPPEIRHRVLECSPGLEVIELGCPADHITCLDHDMPLPTGAVLPDRDYGGQRFVRHVASTAAWQPWRLDGFEARDLGIAAATDGLAGVRVARHSGAHQSALCSHDTEFAFMFVLEGKIGLHTEEHGDHDLRAGDSFVIPAQTPYAFAQVSDDLELLEVTLPADFETMK
jgi:quercetin dioxygenase-like cupin family protein